MKLQPSRILCIDNDTFTYDWICAALQSSKIKSNVTMIGTGQAALNLLVDKVFDLCILDYALPDMTGVQLCTTLRRNGCDVPVMFFTAMDRQIDRERAASAGANEYLCKPDDLDIFVAAATHLIQMRRAIYAEPMRFANLAAVAPGCSF